MLPRSPTIRLCIALMAAVILSEAAAWTFRAFPASRGNGAVYSWTGKPDAVPVEDHNTSLAREQYKADRGGQWKIDTGKSLPITLYYFEWDQLEAAPTMIIDGHHAELCNEIAGFRLLERLPPRTLAGPAGTVVEFDVTHFADPNGRNVFSFKNVWLSDTGNWDVRQKSRQLRLQLAFVRRRDSARVLQAGVFDTRDVDKAWDAFQSEVLSGLVWSNDSRDKSLQR